MEGDAIIRATTVDVASITMEEGRARRERKLIEVQEESKKDEEIDGGGDGRRRRTRRVSPSLVRPRLTLITHSGHGVVRHS